MKSKLFPITDRQINVLLPQCFCVACVLLMCEYNTFVFYGTNTHSTPGTTVNEMTFERLTQTAQLLRMANYR